MRPNILLIVLDAARRDALAPYMSDASATPTIAQLASRGSALPHAYATASWTLPSHASMFTGALPRQLGLTQPPGGSVEGARAVMESMREQLITTRLARSGYSTHGVSANVWASGHVGLDVGFDSFEYVTGGREERVNALLGSGLRSKLAWATDGLRANVDDGAAAAGESMRRLIAQWSGRPTFWFVNLVECHSPYLPPRPWNDLAAGARLLAALEAQRHLNFLSICLYVAGTHRISDAAMSRMRQLYHRSIAYMDDWLAGILEALDARRILEDTLVIVTSDHGENFGEHGLIVHGFALNQPLIHVPLVMAGPGAPQADGVFGLDRLPRLLADVAELHEHPWSEPSRSQDIAIAQYDPMARIGDARTLEFAAKWKLDREGMERLATSFSSATDGRFKLVVTDEGERGYDLRADPEERSPLDLTAAQDPVFLRLREALEASEPRMPSVQPVSASASGASPEELEALERQMRLLGYM